MSEEHIEVDDILLKNEFSFESNSLLNTLRDYINIVPIIGESNKIDKLLQIFTDHYYECNKLTYSKPSLHILVCSIVLLNSDLHEQKEFRKMKLIEYVKNLDGHCDGNNFDREYLVDIYKSIKNDRLTYAHQKKNKKSLSVKSKRISDSLTNFSINSLPKNDSKNSLFPVENFGYKRALFSKVKYSVPGDCKSPSKKKLKTVFLLLYGYHLMIESSNKLFFKTKTQYSILNALAYRKPGGDSSDNTFYLKLMDGTIIEFVALEDDVSTLIQNINFGSALFTEIFPMRVPSNIFEIESPSHKESVSIMKISTKLKIIHGNINLFQFYDDMCSKSSETISTAVNNDTTQKIHEECDKLKIYSLMLLTISLDQVKRFCFDNDPVYNEISNQTLKNNNLMFKSSISVDQDFSLNLVEHCNKFRQSLEIGYNYASDVTDSIKSEKLVVRKKDV